MSEDKKFKFYNGIPCSFIVKSVEDRFSPVERGFATGMFGPVGFFATGSSETREVEVNGFIRLSDFDIILSSNSTGDIRIPYSRVLRCDKLYPCGIVLVSGEKISVNPSDLDIFDFIGDMI